MCDRTVVFGRRGSGQEFPIEASISKVDIGKKRLYTVILRDITEALEAEQELKRSQEQFERAFKSNPQPMSITTFEDGLYIDVNESFLVMSGYTRPEVIGRTSL